MSKLKSYLSNRILPRTSIFFLDVLFVLFSTFLVFVLEYGFSGLGAGSMSMGIRLSILLVVFNSIAFVIFRTYSGVLRFSSFSDLLRIIYALLLGYFMTYVTLVAISYVSPTYDVNLLIFFAIFILNTLLMVSSRIFVKEFYDSITSSKDDLVNVFIYGTKEAGISIAKSLRPNQDINFRVLGFISDEDNMIGKELMGATVYANDEGLFRVLKLKDVETVIVSPQKMDEIRNKDMLVNFVDRNISLLTTPPISEWNGESITKKQIKDIEIEDLLPREPIKMNMAKIASNIEGKKVMVTGAAGSIGSEIVRQVASFNPYSIIVIDSAETPLHNLRLHIKEEWSELRIETFVANVSNASRMEKIFNKTRPHYVFHAAAYKHVPMMETNVSEAVQTNILGTKTVADLSVKYNVNKFVMISTDKAVNPSNVMGCSKRICEIYVQSLSKKNKMQNNGNVTQFITTRFGNVLGSNGSVIPLFREQIKKGGPVTVTHPEIIRYFMTIPEACQLVLEAGSMGKGGEIFIFDMGKPVKILDLAKRMISLSGSKSVKIEFTGLRNGEKLYEELLNSAEHTKPTYHEKIMIADVREYDYDDVSVMIDNLIRVSYEYDDMRTVKKMKQIVPEFLSINSPFETIDRLLNHGPVQSN
ncbi:MAG: polysaccharide biosynthesis protein [Fermentimonas sp.]|jgi:FlaA1/EpsC-like NDP-sugar epimerase